MQLLDTPLRPLSSSSSQDFDPDDPEAALLHPASDAADSAQNLARRPPVVAILGHVDHGKTTLLDRLRHSRLVEAEFGGITQRIGAFTTRVVWNFRISCFPFTRLALQSIGWRFMGSEEENPPHTRPLRTAAGCITFLDTPGHAAFSNMRQRGASATDIAILVVAADDGVMPQTLESLRYISAAGVPMVVAVNKVDKREAQPDSVMQELSKHGVLVEELGGDVQCVPVSALKGSGVERLLEAVLALAELLELRANVQGRAEGVVIESGQSKGLGKTASLLCTRGCVKPGTVLVAGRAFCRVRRMTDDLGRPVDRLLPGRAAEIAGWRQLPPAGESALEAASERLARAVIAQRERRAVEAKSVADAAASEESRREWQRAYSEHLAGLADMSIRERRRHKASDELADTARQLMDSKFAHGTEPRLSLTIRADADGSLEAILGLLSGYADPRCHLDLVSFEVGPPTISDVETLADFDGLLCCFNVPVPQGVSTAAAAAGVPVLEHRVVYHMIADLKARLTAALPPKEEERPLGSADVLQVFHVSGPGPGGSHHKVAVAGCACKSGQLSRKKHFRLVRNGQTVFTGRCASLRHLKSTVETVRSGMECGVQLDLPAGVSYLPGDQIVCFETVAVPQTIDWEPGFGLEDEADP
uniref:Tr-type G domain-containing protein n=1 Tax=Macrostomum lignano TaxID=282301 RepID=A0A1I8HMM5_9PLAT